MQDDAAQVSQHQIRCHKYLVASQGDRRKADNPVFVSECAIESVWKLPPAAILAEPKTIASDSGQLPYIEPQECIAETGATKCPRVPYKRILTVEWARAQAPSGPSDPCGRTILLSHVTPFTFSVIATLLTLTRPPSKPSKDGLTKRVCFIRATCLYLLIGPRSTL